MGIDVVKVALTKVHALGGNDSKVLMHMAARCLDTKDKGRAPFLYYGGEDELLAVVYGMKDAPKYKKWQRDRIGESMKRLREAGLVKRLGRAQTGTRQTWRLIFMTGEAPEQPASEAVENKPVGPRAERSTPEDCPPESGGLHPPETRGQYPLKGGGQYPPETGGPRTEVGQMENELLGLHVSSPSPSGTYAHARPVENDDEISADGSIRDRGVATQAPPATPGLSTLTFGTSHNPTTTAEDNRMLRKLQDVTAAIGQHEQRDTREMTGAQRVKHVHRLNRLRGEEDSLRIALGMPRLSEAAV